MTKTPNALIISIIKFYQLYLSPLFPRTCRFYPSCSSYAMESFQNHSFFKASLLTVKRIGKCHTLHPGGFDPVPIEKDSTDG